MKKLLSLILILFFCYAQADAQEMIPLWPAGNMPNSKGLMLKDSIAQDRLFQVGSPRMYRFLAPQNNNTGAAVLIVPGGGYLRLPARYDDVAAALYFQSKGINAFVLCHRLPTSLDLVTREIAPLQDAQRAMRILHANAGKWGIDTRKIGVFGTSAGGHVASTLGTHFKDVSVIGDAYDSYPYRPNFMMLVSAVISLKDPIAHRGSRENLLGINPSEENIRLYSNEEHVDELTPPTLLIHADNDQAVSPLNSVLFYQSLKEHKIISSLHIFPYGEHRVSIQGNPGSTAMWPEIAVSWLREMKFIP